MTTIDLALPVPDDSQADFSDIVDAQRLVRLHPHWQVERLETADQWTVAHLIHHATRRPFRLAFKLSFPQKHQLRIELRQGPADSIHIYVKHQRLTVAFSPDSDRLAPEAEQDLTLWLQSIRHYLRLYMTASLPARFFRFLMNRAILKMTPSQRKICLMLYRFTVLEIVVLLLILVGYYVLWR